RIGSGSVTPPNLMHGVRPDLATRGPRPRSRDRRTGRVRPVTGARRAPGRRPPAPRPGAPRRSWRAPDRPAAARRRGARPCAAAAARVVRHAPCDPAVAAAGRRGAADHGVRLLGVVVRPPAAAAAQPRGGGGAPVDAAAGPGLVLAPGPLGPGARLLDLADHL